MAEIQGHPQTKGRATGENKLRPKPPRHSSRGSDPNGARITETICFQGLAASCAALMLYTWIYYLSTLYPFLGFCPWNRQQVVGLRSALDSTWFASVRSIADPLLANQVQQERKISGDRRWFIEVSLLKCTDGLVRPIEAQLARQDVAPRAASAMTPRIRL